MLLEVRGLARQMGAVAAKLRKMGVSRSLLNQSRIGKDVLECAVALEQLVELTEELLETLGEARGK